MRVAKHEAALEAWRHLTAHLELEGGVRGRETHRRARGRGAGGADGEEARCGGRRRARFCGQVVVGAARQMLWPLLLGEFREAEAGGWEACAARPKDVLIAVASGGEGAEAEAEAEAQDAAPGDVFADSPGRLGRGRRRLLWAKQDEPGRRPPAGVRLLVRHRRCCAGGGRGVRRLGQPLVEVEELLHGGCQHRAQAGRGQNWRSGQCGH
mmetsp:Transcript_127162/g.406865  ORF Transcript_127162/g.406865 Transcript_127162/m.406865 type:complete len:210 (-) Transcript_127162:100-729(-)